MTKKKDEAKVENPKHSDGDHSDPDELITHLLELEGALEAELEAQPDIIKPALNRVLGGITQLKNALDTTVRLTRPE